MRGVLKASLESMPSLLLITATSTIKIETFLLVWSILSMILLPRKTFPDTKRPATTVINHSFCSTELCKALIPLEKEFTSPNI